MSEPVTIIREGITVNIEQAVLTKEKTIIVYSYILPADFFIPDNTFGDSRSPVLILPDGTRLEPLVRQRLNTMDCPQCSMRYELDFSAIPGNVTGAVLELPSLVAVPVELAPQDWKFQLNFKVADSSDIAPVIEQVVTPVPTAMAANPCLSFHTVSRITLINSLPCPMVIFCMAVFRGQILSSARMVRTPTWPVLKMPMEWKSHLIMQMLKCILLSLMNCQYWAYKIGSTFTAPLTLSFAMTASIPADGGSFTFDPGPDPQLGQKWDINQGVTVNGEVIHVLTVEEAGIEPGYFLFTMQSDSNIIGAAIADLNYPMMGGGGGGGGMPEERVPFFSGFGYQVPIPQGPLTMTFINIQMVIPGDWNIVWSP
ncbi:MAG: hypothetical protein IPN96_07950 [Anaerolineales bacterium]|nr:hypothetical protein [Anaerolineales bacterium]